MKPTVNRKLASDKQRSTVVQLSEQKNDPHSHYKIMSSLMNMTASDASFEIGRFGNNREFVVRKVHLMNQKITENPTWYLENVQAEEDYENRALYEHKLRIFTKGFDEKDVRSMCIAYIELKDQPSFKTLLKEQYPGIEDKIKEFLNKLNPAFDSDAVYNNLIIK